MREFVLGDGVQSGLHYPVPVIERNLAAGDAAYLRSNTVIDLESNGQKPELVVIRGRAKVDGLKKDFIKMLTAKPPVPHLFTSQGFGEGILSHITRESW